MCWALGRWGTKRVHNWIVGKGGDTMGFLLFGGREMWGEVWL